MHVVLWVCLGLGVVYGCDCDCYLLCLSLLVVACWLPGVVWFACASMLVLLCWLLISLMFNSVGHLLVHVRYLVVVCGCHFLNFAWVFVFYCLCLRWFMSCFCCIGFLRFCLLNCVIFGCGVSFVGAFLDCGFISG